ncbi:MAG: hypothetical protein ACYSTY_12995 [Planctomycetota bacterium]|jgi:hypothetical protein
MLNALNVANAAKLLAELPPEGGSLHCVMRGHFNAWDLVPAVYRLAGVAILDLHIATLSYNRHNVERLDAMLEAEQIRAVWFLSSSWIRSADADVWEHLRHVLLPRGHRLAAAPSHAKIQLFELEDGYRYVIGELREPPLMPQRRAIHAHAGRPAPRFPRRLD